MDQAVADGAVVPLLYEGRIVPQEVHEKPIDSYFNKVCEPLTDYQRADLKKKYSRADQLNQAEQRIYAIAWDISLHFRDNWQGTKFKGQLVCPTKRVAVKYKRFFDEIGIVSTEVLITAPDDREGEESAYAKTTESVKTFWKKMMQEHGTARKYETNLINRFKQDSSPEIIIVVDKLLTGFDEPRNTVMYLDRFLTGHTLLQAVARVNRVCDDKDFGYIIDYYGVIDPLNQALSLYSDFDPEDLNGTFTDVSEEVKKLPQKYSDLWDVFKAVANKRDLEAYSQLLRVEDIRQLFYERLRSFAHSMKIALSSVCFYEMNDEQQVRCYKEDLAMFMKLRMTVQLRYSDAVDFRHYESQIQKLIDTHIESEGVKVITELVNIFDKERFAEEVEKMGGKAAQADTIASRTARHITEKMETDPSFYKKFSDLLKETIAAYEQGRIQEAEYLKRVKEQMEAVLSHTGSDIPSELSQNDAGKAYYGLCFEIYQSLRIEEGIDLRHWALVTARAMDRIVRKYVLDQGTTVVDWQKNTDLIGQMKIEMEDFLMDEVKEKEEIPLTFSEIDTLVDHCVNIAKQWFK